MTTITAPFGRRLTAMITPMSPDGAVDFDGAAQLAAYLVDDMRNEGLVLNGTTGEAPTTTDEEKSRLIKVVLETVGDRAKVAGELGKLNLGAAEVRNPDGTPAAAAARATSIR